ncbi:hypothetical protein K5X82_09535 [Halosquirtibacter xylanolyticus]|uniref:hypothetical protein n=1 Tax=Halosquirtibacter xylanolyticus TaxID=3374599 RepID=UPI00374989B6|nr:hypothetical protein K5X82_09535 [Prolixibacteraceae bacterium]
MDYILMCVSIMARGTSSRHHCPLGTEKLSPTALRLLQIWVRVGRRRFTENRFLLKSRFFCVYTLCNNNVYGLYLNVVSPLWQEGPLPDIIALWEQRS